MGIESIITIVIVAVTAVWAGRGIWRAVRRRLAEPATDATICGGGCGQCPVAPGQRREGEACTLPEAEELAPQPRADRPAD
ncbi:hypothetical protein GF314_15105 [bacterium]|nr:hypothetical protein [bacterium]